MKTASAGLISHIEQARPQAWTLATCWKIKRTDGVILGFTDHDKPLDIDLSDGDGTITYEASLETQKTALSGEAGTSVDTQELAGFIDDVVVSSADLRSGRYDHAEIKIFQVNWNNLADGILRWRRGYIGSVKESGSIWKAELRSLTEGFKNEIIELYSAACRADLFDSRCGLSAAAFTFSVTVATVTNNQVFTVTDHGSPTETRFQNGMVTFTGGLNSGLKMEIKAWNGGTNEITLFQPMPFTIAVSDGLDMRPGCNKDVAACKSYNNIENMRAEPYVPGNDLLFKTPDAP